MMNKKRTRTTGHIKYALFAPLTAALLLVSNIETVARTAERLIYSTEESTPRPEREEVASFVNTTVQGLVTFTITVTNSEGKPQPNITLQIKPGNEVKTFKTNAEGFIQQMIFTISLIMTSMECHWRTWVCSCVRISCFSSSFSPGR